MTPDPAAVRDAVRAHDGVAAVSVLVALGHSRWAIRRAVERGMLVRVRPGWLAIPGADPALVAAARHGVVLSCITQARRRGLWVLAGAETHVAAPSHSGRANAARATVHWSRPVVPRHPHALVDPIENVLALVAVCQPFEAALAVWESALRQEQVDRGTLRGWRCRPRLERSSRRPRSSPTPDWRPSSSRGCGGCGCRCDGRSGSPVTASTS